MKKSFKKLRFTSFLRSRVLLVSDKKSVNPSLEKRMPRRGLFCPARFSRLRNPRLHFFLDLLSFNEQVFSCNDVNTNPLAHSKKCRTVSNKLLSVLVSSVVSLSFSLVCDVAQLFLFLQMIKDDLGET